ncbi:MAG: hypothetical protein ACYCO0_04280 [Candidatus Micrarchaeaceae archaeon]
MSDKNRMQQKQKPEAAKAKKHGKGLKIAAAVLLILILGGAYIYLTYGSLPSAILSAKQLNYSTIRSIALQKEASTLMMSVSYIGSIEVNNTDPYVQVAFSKYHNDSRTTFNLTSLPVVGSVNEIGNMSAVIISLNNGTSGYSCVKVWNSAATAGGRYSCSSLSNVSGNFESLIGDLVNISSLKNLHMDSYGLSFYEGQQPCYSVSGTGSIMVNGALVGMAGYVPSNFSFSACVSAQYDIPLMLIGTMSTRGGKFVHVDMLQSGINFTTDYSQVTSLPT